MANTRLGRSSIRRRPIVAGQDYPAEFSQLGDTGEQRHRRRDYDSEGQYRPGGQPGRSWPRAADLKSGTPSGSATKRIPCTSVDPWRAAPAEYQVTVSGVGSKVLTTDGDGYIESDLFKASQDVILTDLGTGQPINIGRDFCISGNDLTQNAARLESELSRTGSGSPGPIPRSAVRAESSHRPRHKREHGDSSDSGPPGHDSHERGGKQSIRHRSDQRANGPTTTILAPPEMFCPMRTASRTIGPRRTQQFRKGCISNTRRRFIRYISRTPPEKLKSRPPSIPSRAEALSYWKTDFQIALLSMLREGCRSRHTPMMGSA